MLSRGEAVKKLIELRKILADRESELEAIPDDYHSKFKEELDQLLIDMIGVPREGRHQVNSILNKAVKGEIKPRTAGVAVHEIYNDFQQREDSSSPTAEADTSSKPVTSQAATVQGDSPYDLEELYKSGYR